MCDVNNFVQEQVRLLNLEKKCYSQQVEDDRKAGGTLCGTVVKNTEPRYGGTIVTLQLKSSRNNAELPFKQNNPIGLGDINNDEELYGIVVLIK